MLGSPEINNMHACKSYYFQSVLPNMRQEQIYPAKSETYKIMVTLFCVNCTEQYIYVVDKVRYWWDLM